MKLSIGVKLNIPLVLVLFDPRLVFIQSRVIRVDPKQVVGCAVRNVVINMQDSRVAENRVIPLNVASSFHEVVNTYTFPISASWS